MLGKPKYNHWIHWPANKKPNWLPWYTIMRRLVFILPAIVGVCFLCVVLVLGWGINEARSFWN